jgi:hypothetical protein
MIAKNYILVGVAYLSSGDGYCPTFQRRCATNMSVARSQEN